MKSRREWVRMSGLLVVVVGLSGCSGDPPPFAGRWDVTVTEGGGTEYPLWIELNNTAGNWAGRIQPRWGHSVEMESVQVMDGSIELKHGDLRLAGTWAEGSIRGSGSQGDREVRWVAHRAPELPGRKVVPGEPVVLFNGSDLTGWRPRDERENFWTAQDGVLENLGSGTDLVTEDSFSDFQLHVEVRVPEGGNSGIYLRGRYEVQIQDDLGNPPSSRGMGGIYGQVTPVRNSAREAGFWQDLEITLVGRWVTVVLNGDTIIDHQEIPGLTGGALDSREGEPGPIFLQGDHGPVSYRNFLLRPIP